MCGIVGVVAERNAVPILLEGLRRLEYRGYDSAGLAVLKPGHGLARLRTVGKVDRLRASRTPAGPRTASPRRATRIRTSRATGSRSSTTASSKTTRRCAPG